jgi:hypothetical protein
VLLTVASLFITLFYSVVPTASRQCLPSGLFVINNTNSAASETAADLEQLGLAPASPKLAINTTGAATSMARVYTDVNAQMPRAYWDYDSVNISWGVLENYEVVRKIGRISAHYESK